MNSRSWNGERGRPGCTGRRLADRNQADAPHLVLGETPDTAGGTPALPIALSGSWAQRAKAVRSGLCLPLLAGIIALAAENSEPHVLSGQTMGTTFSVKFTPNSTLSPEQDRENVEIEINRRLEKINDQMSTYRPDSELSRFNRCGHTNWFPVSRELIEVFEQARAIGECSNGAFDITVGPLVNLWGFGPDKRAWQIPAEEDIGRLLPRVGFRRIAIRTSPPSLRKELPAVYCDLSAIAKGYGVDQIAEYLESIRVQNYLVQIGGEVRAKGRNPSGKVWRVGIQNPSRPDGIRHSIPLRDQALSTSGDYVQSFEENGRRYSHTIDPRTGRPVTHAVTSVTVLHASSTLADGWATALNVLGPDAGFQLALQKHLPVLMILRTAEGFTEKMTPAFEELIFHSPAP